ncbi:MAG: glycosyltransferase family 2 protein [Bacteroidota bacterium]|nr:glycosyltransferase family 2 protein [Bacteroidota bacterium]
MTKTCIIIPCYNEASRLKVNLFTDFLNNNKGYDILFVNDGSSDNTLDVIYKISNNYPDNCFVLNLEKNAGKAEAIRQGILKMASSNKYKYLAYLDADLATPFSEVLLMENIAEQNPDLWLILCSRWKRLGSNIIRKRKRHLLGRVFATFASIILKLPVYDTQCGAKLIRSDIASSIFNEPFITSWLFDIELIARIRNLNKANIEQLLFEHAVMEWQDVEGSKLKLSHMFKVPLQLLKINRKYN